MKVGDTLVLTTKTKRLSPNQRSGVIEDVLDPEQPRVLVRWGDGRASVIAPLPGSFRIEAAKAEKASRKKTGSRRRA